MKFNNLNWIKWTPDDYELGLDTNGQPDSERQILALFLNVKGIIQSASPSKDTLYFLGKPMPSNMTHIIISTRESPPKISFPQEVFFK